MASHIPVRSLQRGQKLAGGGYHSLDLPRVGGSGYQALHTREIQSHLQRCQNLPSVLTLVDEHSADFDSVNIATALMKIAKLSSGSGGRSSIDHEKLAASVALLTKTLRHPHYHQLADPQCLSNVVYAVGRLKIRDDGLMKKVFASLAKINPALSSGRAQSSAGDSGLPSFPELLPGSGSGSTNRPVEHLRPSSKLRGSGPFAVDPPKFRGDGSLFLNSTGLSQIVGGFAQLGSATLLPPLNLLQELSNRWHELPARVSCGCAASLAKLAQTVDASSSSTLSDDSLGTRLLEGQQDPAAGCRGTGTTGSPSVPVFLQAVGGLFLHRVLATDITGSKLEGQDISLLCWALSVVFADVVNRGGVCWDGNGLAYPRIGPVSDQCHAECIAHATVSNLS